MRYCPPSALTLGGLAKHLARVEDSWFHEDFLGAQMPECWSGVPPAEVDPDWEFHSAAQDTPSQLIALYQEACARSRAIVAQASSLEALSVRIPEREGIAFSLRWILLHLIEETARHNGHADLLRENLDGVVGE